MATGDGDEPTCTRCGDPKPEGGDLCPHCKDLWDAALTHDHPPGVTRRAPPHGNTTR